MTNLRFSEECEFWVGPAITSLSTSATLESQMVQVSQTEDDTTINVGKSTVTGDDVEDVAQSFTADCEFLTKKIADSIPYSYLNTIQVSTAYNFNV